MSEMRLQVNDRRIDWDDEGNDLRQCKSCGGSTRGRASLDSPRRAFANLPYCMNCAMSQTLSGEILNKPAKELRG